MNENINLIEILKDCPKGTKLYSTIHGECELFRVDDIQYSYPIKIMTNDSIEYYTKEGKFNKHFNGECVLFPSKENRDWSTFKVPKEEKVPKKEYKFKPFDKVLVRNYNTDTWECDVFSHISDDKYTCIGSRWKYCIPYEGNEHLLDTTNEPI